MPYKDQPKEDPAVVKGGPVGEPLEVEERSEPPVSGKRIKYSGREFDVSDDLASMWEEREASFQRKLTEQGAELGQLRQRVQAPAPPVQPQPSAAVDDYDTLFFESPSKAAARLRDEAKAETIEEIKSMYRKEAAVRQFWTDFYEVNPDLKDAEMLVNASLQQHQSTLYPMPTDEAAVKLASLTREYLAKFSGKASGTKQTLPQGRTAVEGAGKGKPTAAPAKREELGGITETLLARRKARREAAMKLRRKE